MNDNEIMAVILAKGVVVPLVLQSADCITCAPAQRGSTHSSAKSISVDERQRGNISLEANPVSGLLEVCTSHRPGEGREDKLGREPQFEKRN